MERSRNGADNAENRSDKMSTEKVNTALAGNSANRLSNYDDRNDGSKMKRSDQQSYPNQIDLGAPPVDERYEYENDGVFIAKQIESVCLRFEEMMVQLRGNQTAEHNLLTAVSKQIYLQRKFLEQETKRLRDAEIRRSAGEQLRRESRNGFAQAIKNLFNSKQAKDQLSDLRRFQEDCLLIEASGLFDPAWYASRNPDLTGMDLFDHYVRHGGREGRAAGPDFDDGWYLSVYPDVAAENLHPLVHYLRHGINEGRQRRPIQQKTCQDTSTSTRVAVSEEDRLLIEMSGLFDKDWYADHNPDLRGTDLFDHYIQHGGREGRAAGPNFDDRWYLSAYPDVATSGIHPLAHYLRYGVYQGRSKLPHETGPQLNVGSSTRTTITASDEDRLLIETSGLFDPTWYGERYPDLRGLNLLDHYVRHGGHEGRAASPSFDGGRYLSTYPDVGLSGMHPLVHYLRYGIHEGRRAGLPPAILGALKSASEAFSMYEPEIARDRAFEHIDRLPINYSVNESRLVRVWARIFADLNSAYDRLIFIPWLTRGGADLVAMNAARSVMEIHGDYAVLIIASDYDIVTARDWLPESASLLVLSDYDAELSHEERVRIVEMLIYAISPKAVLNVNSRACWDAFVGRGCALSNISELYATLFCRDYSSEGRPGGYADTHFAPALRHLTKVYIDNESFIEELKIDYMIPQGLATKLHFLPQPISPNITRLEFTGGDDDQQMRVLWSGRFTHQKNISLLVEIIKRASNVHFDIYGDGQGPEAEQLLVLASAVENVSLKGPFASIASLQTNHYEAYLFTSLWEGMPTTLINVAARGIPIVATDVGGIAELINVDTGWLVCDINSPEAYLAALDEIRTQPAEAARRAAALVQHVQGRHSQEAYTHAFCVQPSFLL